MLYTSWYNIDAWDETNSFSYKLIQDELCKTAFASFILKVFWKLPWGQNNDLTFFVPTEKQRNQRRLLPTTFIASKCQKNAKLSLLTFFNIHCYKLSEIS